MLCQKLQIFSNFSLIPCALVFVVSRRFSDFHATFILQIALFRLERGSGGFDGFTLIFLLMIYSFDKNSLKSVFISVNLCSDEKVSRNESAGR